MEDKRTIVVVCGYGCHLDTPLRPYLDRVVKFVEENRTGLLILCGGETQKSSAPGVSEARLMRNYVARKIPPSCHLLIAQSSYTTYENIKCATALITQIEDLSMFSVSGRNKIVVFCEAQRAATVIMLARHFLLPFVAGIDDITVETASWERADPFKHVKNLVYNRLAIKFPFLARREGRKRRERSKYI